MLNEEEPVRRRDFIIGLGGAAAVSGLWPMTARGQQRERVRRIGLLSDFSESQMQPLIEAFLKRLQQLGWSENAIRMQNYFAIGDATQFQSCSPKGFVRNA